ncbi:radical SAM family heme chaperone HemW [Neotabrizicola sp. sgz301269]|uniref:radical SAM family heme chaperone HemW n=1 Tax=Neotabrizicola sp. sgz301269 TaxID=3276282 RepID=UPI0037701038
MKQPEDWQEGGFALYLHWPFCKAKCPYCDFNSHVRAAVDQKDWQAAYLAEIDRAAAETPDRLLRSVFFGGGTPSLMEGPLVAAILERIAKHWRFANDIEITLEANPTSVEAGRFREYRAAGVNRVSLGLQALNDEDLRRLGRQHSAAEALAAFALARDVFPRVSGDLIYARQDQTLAAWQEELQRLIALGPDHLSLYQLTIEDGTAFGALARAGKLKGLPDEDLAADMYAATSEITAKARLSAYEVSNYAAAGAESRHNLVYWRMGDYLGIGPGAHGRLTLDGKRYATDTQRNPEAWLAAVRNGSGEKPRELVDPAAQGTEYLLMALRLTEGASLRRFARMTGQEIAPDRVKSLVEDGFLTVDGEMIAATEAGRLLLNRLVLELMPD